MYFAVLGERSSVLSTVADGLHLLFILTMSVGDCCIKDVVLSARKLTVA